MQNFILIFTFIANAFAFSQAHVDVQSPRHPKKKIPYSTKSDLDGVCLSLGHSGWVHGFNQVAYTGKKTQRAIVDSYGDLVEVENSFSQEVKSLRCLR